MSERKSHTQRKDTSLHLNTNRPQIARSPDRVKKNKEGIGAE